jgi:6-phosphogluconolactonase
VKVLGTGLRECLRVSFDRGMKSNRNSLRASSLLPGLLLVGLILAAVFSAAAAPAPAKGKYIFYVGTYTEEKGSTSKGIYAYSFDVSTGKSTSLGLAAEAVNPSFVALSPNGKYLYAVNEVPKFNGPNSGGVSAFSIDRANGKLTFLNEVASRGADPCYITVDKTGKNVLVANYTGGSVAVFPVQADGKLGESSAFDQHTGKGPNAERQEGPHAHSIDVSEDNRFAIVDDLGLDEVMVYKFDSAKGTLTPNTPPFAKVDPGAGPRHFAVRPDQKFAYVVSEMHSSVTVFSNDESNGTLKPLQTISTIPANFKDYNDGAEIHVGRSGKFLYTSNRGQDTIAVFAIDREKGTLTSVEYAPTQGKTPRSFEIDPTGQYLFAENEKSNNIVVFKIDQETGRLTATGQVLDVPEPVCVKFLAVQ